MGVSKNQLRVSKTSLTIETKEERSEFRAAKRETQRDSHEREEVKNGV